MSKISVFVRIRPILQNDKKNNHTISTTNNFAVPRLQPDHNLHQVRVINENNDKVKTFKFNKILMPNYSQQQVFTEAEANKLVDKVIQGYHSTIFAYGQTGSGKTYSMQGFEYDLLDGVPKLVSANLSEENKNLGIIPRAISYLFSQIKHIQNRSFQISLSYLQIYNEKIYDLLDFDNKQKIQNGLKLRWNKYDQFGVQNLEAITCRNLNQALQLYIKGAKNKVMAKHKMNVNSSRSHTILMVKVQSFDNEDPKNILSSRLQLVDLAGSQKHSLTGSVGKVFKQGIQINKSLFTLRQVISSLFQFNKNQGKNINISDVHIPYRQSKLTSILKQSIGGNGYCVMIACINPENIYLEQSIQTLTYASMASYIDNVPIRNQDPKIQEINQLKKQLSEVTQQLHRANQHIKILSELANKKLQPDGLSKQYNKQDGQKLSQTTQINQNLNSQEYNQSHSPMSKRLNNLKPKQFIQSINMIKDLLQSNIFLRENIQQLTKALNKRDTQIYQITKQNQSLREKCENCKMSYLPTISSNIIQTQKIIMPKLKTVEDRRTNSLYDQILNEKSNKPLVLKKLHSGNLDSVRDLKKLDISYNELLKKRSIKKQSAKSRKYTNLSYI